MKTELLATTRYTDFFVKPQNLIKLIPFTKPSFQKLKNLSFPPITKLKIAPKNIKLATGKKKTLKI
ncbi:MAG: hypothetical protein AAB336_12810, partial [Acidobacteriota bacterium]